MTAPEPLVSLEGVEFRWPGRRDFELRVPEFSIMAGQTVLLLGASGSGKSTLLALISGTVTPQSGTIRVCGTELGALSRSARDRFRAESLGVIFQQFNLLPFATVVDNITLPLRFARNRRARVTDPRAVAGDLCSSLGLDRSLLTARAATLSVGQQQRVAVARALIGAPPLVVADEPTSALDNENQSAFLDQLFGQARAAGSTVLMVSHDPRLSERFDRTMHIDDIVKNARQVA